MIHNRQKLALATLVALGLLSTPLLVRIVPPEPDEQGENPAKSERIASRAGHSVGVELAPTGKTSVSGALSVSQEATPSEQIAALLSQPLDLSDPEVRDGVIAEIKRLEALEHEALVARAAASDYPLVTDLGAVLTGFAGETPLYDIPHNAESAIATGANLLQAAPFSLTGTGRAIGQWEVGAVPLLIHDEFVGRVTPMDGTLTTSFHASHVAGTMIAAGADPLARGMAPGANILAHSSTNVISELTALAATAPGQPGMIQISNHAYGAASGWEFDGTSWFGTFSDDANGTNDFAQFFGQYTSETAAWDGLAWNAPYHLIFKSSGNHRDDAAPLASTPWALNGSGVYSYDPLSHPVSDFDQESTSFGFGTLDPRSSAKNVMTVASVKDVVDASMNRTVSTGTSSLFSSAGPTDDGRIKPDLVADGDSVLSAGDLFEQHYGTSRGTSMAVASAAGSAALLNEHYEGLFPGTAMRASTLKGLLIHTADDMGRPGPDYEYGWGLMNVKSAADLLTAHAVDPDWGHVVEEEISNTNPDDQFTFTHAGGPLRVTICWTDPAGNWTSGHNNRSPRLVHDLNLTVNPQFGFPEYPYVMPFVGSWQEADLQAVAQKGVNTVDNVEQVDLSDVAPGTYTINIARGALPLAQGSQKYSLLISGAQVTSVPDVKVLNAVAPALVMEEDLSPLTAIANLNDVFLGPGLQFSVTLWGAGAVTHTLNPDGTLDLFQVPGQLGTTIVQLDAVDSFGRTATTSFQVSIVSDTIFVNANSPADPAAQTGYSWSEALSNLQDALSVALPGQMIWVAEGVYYPDQSGTSDSDDRYDYFLLPGGVSMYGGFAGFESDLSERDFVTRQTILSGDIHQDDSQQPVADLLLPLTGSFNNSYNVLDLSGTLSGDRVDGFVVTAGYADPSGWTVGAGIWVDRAAPTIANCVVSGNEASEDGGGLWLEKTDSSEVVKIQNCKFVGNKAALSGGGLCLLEGIVDIKNCEIRGNEAAFAGGGIYIATGVVQMQSSEVRGNEASVGGGIYIYKDDVDVVNCLVSGNRSTFGGGGVYLEQGNLQFTSSSLAGNFSGGEGGALYIEKGKETAPTQIENCILWNNWASGSTTAPSASIYVIDPLHKPMVSDSLIANSGGSASWNPSLGIDNGGNIDADPTFVAGIEPTAAPSGEGDFSLQVSSPAIDSGNIGLLPADVLDLDGDTDMLEAVPFDLTGSARVAGASVDMGAYELGDSGILDSDNDGMSDAFEIAHGGTTTAIDPTSDADGDGLSALAEFVHGEDPNAPLSGPVGDYAPMDYLGTNYLCVTFRVDAEALNFVDLVLERRGNLTSPLGWQGGQTLLMSSVPSATDPGMLEVTFRSLVPFGQDGMEFLRLRHDPKP